MGNILSLSFELQSQIPSYLDPMHSTCLGLTYKRLYAIHPSLSKITPLDAFTYECLIPSTALSTICFLFTHLESWKPPALNYCGGCRKSCRTSKASEQARQRCDRCISTHVEYHCFRWLYLRTLPGEDLAWERLSRPSEAAAERLCIHILMVDGSYRRYLMRGELGQKGAFPHYLVCFQRS